MASGEGWEVSTFQTNLLTFKINNIFKTLVDDLQEFELYRKSVHCLLTSFALCINSFKKYDAHSFDLSNDGSLNCKYHTRGLNDDM